MPKRSSSRRPTASSDHGPVGFLSDREQEILRLVVHSFVEHAFPVGSRFLSRQYPLGLSPASIRNTMSDLEEQGYLEHPYTSAGRVPTELGYRVFVDQLMESRQLSPAEKKALKRELDRLVGDSERLLRESSRILSSLTNLLGIVLTPALGRGVLERIEVVPLSSTRAMFVISVRGGLVRTIVMRLETEVDRDGLVRVVQFLNERLAGLTLEDIRKTGAERVADYDDDVTGIVQLVTQEANALFSEPAGEDRLELGDPAGLIDQPEFQEPEDLRTLIELIQDKNTVVSLVDDAGIELPGLGQATVSIGSEHGDEAARYSIVAARYQLGEMVGTIGVIGPKRMDYSHTVSMVETMARMLTERTQDR